jgi:hypothetical protein
MTESERRPHIIDAGPAINFLATKNQRILIAAIGGPFHAPEAVRDEVMRKAAQEPRFAPAAQEWKKLEANWIKLLPATRTPGLDKIAQILTRNPLPTLPSKAKDLGETFVVIHATATALAGEEVYVIIDDQGGQALTARAQRFLSAQKRDRPSVGKVTLMTTESILRSQIDTPNIKDKPTMRRIYTQLQTVDSGLADISTTDLVTHARWKERPRR